PAGRPSKVYPPLADMNRTACSMQLPPAPAAGNHQRYSAGSVCRRWCLPLSWYGFLYGFQYST
ncbi:hypothetical protein Trydic_g10284, partial [Trypoxylus dichotomus]